MSEETSSEHEHSHEHHEHHASHEREHAHGESHEHSHSRSEQKIMGLSKTSFALAVIVIGVLVIAAVMMFGGGGKTPSASPTPAASALPLGQKADLEQLKVKLVNFLDAKFLATQGLTAKIANVTEKNGVYEFNVDITKDGETLETTPVFVTLDGAKVILGSAVPLVDVTPVPSPTPAPKSETPDVKLFVMSMCPYGVQAEYAMIPVIKLLGDKANFDVRFIANEDGKGGFKSLHGQPEVDENLRQVCISANQKDKFLSYLECFVKEPAEALNANDIAAYQSVNWTKMAADCMATAKVDAANVTACMKGAQGAELLKKNIALADELGVGSSPTITINGADYGGARSSEALKQGVCNAFNAAPAECAQELSSAVGTSSNVGCG